MAKQDPKFYCGHRERLRQKFLDDKLVDYEKLELMLGYVIPRRDVRPLAHALLNKFGSISQVLTASMEELLAFPGIGRNVAIFFKLVYQIILDGYRSSMDAKPIFHDINILKNYCRWTFANKQVEELHVLYLDSGFHLLHSEKHSEGTFDSTSIYIREIVKHALKLNSTVIVIIHNHPASSNGFSGPDICSTEELYNIFANLDIRLYDHLLVSGNSVYSARDLGIIHD